MISNQNALLWGYGSRHDNVIENGVVEERLFSAKNIELLTIRAENWKTNARMLKLKSTDFTANASKYSSCNTFFEVCFNINLYDNNFKSTCYTRMWWVRHIYIYIICHRFLWNIMRYWLHVRISMWKVVHYSEEAEES